VAIGAFFLILGLFPAAGNKQTVHLIVGFTAVALAIVMGVVFAKVRDKLLKQGAKPQTFRSAIAEKITFYAWLAFMVFLIALPFYVIVITAIKHDGEATAMPFTLWPKMGVQFDSFVKVLLNEDLEIDIIGSFINTLHTAVGPTLASVFVSAISAYAFSKLEFRGKSTLFGVLLITMMVPGCITMLSSYLLYDLIGWTHSFLPLIVPSFFGGAGIVFFLREYYSGVPDDLLGSAQIDGLGDIGIFFQIMLPLSVPALLAQLVLTFVGRYNDYLGPLIYLTENQYYTLQIFLRAFTSGNVLFPNRVAAACIIALAPLMVIYLFLQNIILSGIAMSSGLKA
jgi:multiple sugar transport system permease protein